MKAGYSIQVTDWGGISNKRVLEPVREVTAARNLAINNLGQGHPLWRADALNQLAVADIDAGMAVHIKA